MYKIAIIFINELQNDPANLITRCSEAVLQAYKAAGWRRRKKWEKDGRQKVVVHVIDKMNIMQIHGNARKFSIPNFLLDGEQKNAILIIGPEEPEKMNKLSATLRLF